MTFFSMINLKSLNRHYCSHFPCTHIHLIFHFFLWFHFLRKSHFIFHCQLYCLYSCQYYFNRQSLSLANHKHHYNFNDCCKDFTNKQHIILLLIVLTFLGTLCSFQILTILFPLFNFSRSIQFSSLKVPRSNKYLGYLLQTKNTL